MDTTSSLDVFTRAYIKTAIGLSESPGKTVDDIDPSTLKQIIEDCEAFQSTNADVPGIYSGRAGCDFFLTRNRHGAGFWDGDWEEPHGKTLTDCAHAYGTFELYEGDDGKVYSHG